MAFNKIFKKYYTIEISILRFFHKPSFLSFFRKINQMSVINCINKSENKHHNRLTLDFSLRYYYNPFLRQVTIGWNEKWILDTRQISPILFLSSGFLYSQWMNEKMNHRRCIATDIYKAHNLCNAFHFKISCYLELWVYIVFNPFIIIVFVCLLFYYITIIFVNKDLETW